MFTDPIALAILAGALTVAALVTWIVGILIGRRLARRSMMLARIVTAFAAPVIALGVGIVLFRIGSAAYPGSDGPPMALAGTIMISQLMLLATVPVTWLSIRRRPASMVPDSPRTPVAEPAAKPVTIRMTRDSVGMADDVHAPHEETFATSGDATLADVAAAVATSSYLPMPSDAWGWTIEVGGVVVAIRPALLRRRVILLQGDPTTVMAHDHPELAAFYVRPGSHWRDVSQTTGLSEEQGER